MAEQLTLNQPVEGSSPSRLTSFPRKTGGAFETVLVLLIMVVFAGLLMLQQAFKSGRSPLLQTIYVHLYNGLYIDVYITRVLERVWPAPLAAAK